jgi:hypothetical protein
MAVVLPALLGALFGVGLIVSRLVQPGAIHELLDLGGAWSPALVVMMASGAATYAIGYRIVLRRRRDPWLDVKFYVPGPRDVDEQLVLGAAIFGVGWGLAGMCPAPGLVALGAGAPHGLVFVAALVAGMALHRAVTRPR